MHTSCPTSNLDMDTEFAKIVNVSKNYEKSTSRQKSETFSDGNKVRQSPKDPPIKIETVIEKIEEVVDKGYGEIHIKVHDNAIRHVKKTGSGSTDEQVKNL